ncbi:hypothetical protein scyTo_0021023 [Scyliorhinus torazame]|uniref:NACHT domain-containing protein n=1 Tax=Scyliorhinus torazame TaxID=75743 RepID=A0A401PU56_SCYTO|nr:hypothetical protein [Scyliorhinus torazame]
MHHYPLQKVTELVEKGNRAGSSKLLLNLVMEKGSRARRVMWESFVMMRIGVPKLDKILKEIQELGSNPFDYLNITHGLLELPSHLNDVQRKHKETLRVQTETLRMNTILIKEKVKIFQLVDRYAELTVISTVRDRTLVEHELLARGRDHEEWREKLLRRELEKIRTDQLFQSSWTGFLLQKANSLFWQSNSGRSAAVSGVPGIGKTTMVQKMVYDWATGKIYPHFQFVFSFKFRNLNTVNCRINLRNLILDQYPYFGNVLGELWKNPEGLLFIFDGLDEFNDRIDFADTRRNTEPQSMCTDPECRTNRSLKNLNLSNNKLGDAAVRLLSVALRNPECKIQTLGLADVCLTVSCATVLVSILDTNQSLTDLNLSNNKLGDSGVKLLGEALRKPDCKIQKLG